VTVVFAAIIIATLAQAHADAPEVFRLDCRYTRPAHEPEGAAHVLFLPDDDLFAPPMADPHEPHMVLALRRDRFIGAPFVTNAADATITTGLVEAGGHFGILGRRRDGGCNGFQAGILGGVSGQFNMSTPHHDLMTTDFIAGAQVSARKGAFSIRLRGYHQSSHYGDELLLRTPPANPKEFGFEAIDALVSIEASALRIYGGGGFLDFAFGDPDTAMAQAGIELRKRSDDGGFRPVAGVDLAALDARDWGLTTSIAAGFEWTSPSAIRRLRGQVVFLDGFTPHGQNIFVQKMRGVGLQAQFDF
jgi:hypothetical protein